jgi:hypothetical protein
MLNPKQRHWIAHEAQRSRQRQQRRIDRAALLIACGLAAAIVIGMQAIIKYILG